MIHNAGHSYDECKVLKYHGDKYKNQADSQGTKTAYKKRVKFNSKTEVNDEELNTMVQKSVTAALKGDKKKRTRVIATYIGKSRY